MKLSRLHISIVLYSTPISDLYKCLSSIKNSITDSFDVYITLIDHSPFSMRVAIEGLGLLSSLHCVYIHDRFNPGYASGHNRALLHSIDHNFDYHLVLNPDIYFSPSTISDLIAHMTTHKSVGLAMPSVYSFDGELQYLCKLIPHPFDFLFRILPFTRSLPTKFNLFSKIASTSSVPVSVPYLSGCFMFIRVSYINYELMFDSQFFLYPEDLDFSRRLYSVCDCQYVPSVRVTHRHVAASKKSLRLFLAHLFNMSLYYMKWGWFIDSDRSKANFLALSRLRY